MGSRQSFVLLYTIQQPITQQSIVFVQKYTKCYFYIPTRSIGISTPLKGVKLSGQEALSARVIYGVVRSVAVSFVWELVEMCHATVCSRFLSSRFHRIGRTECGQR